MVSCIPAWYGRVSYDIFGAIYDTNYKGPQVTGLAISELSRSVPKLAVPELTLRATPSRAKLADPSLPGLEVQCYCHAGIVA